MKGAQVSGNLTTESRSIESGQGKSMWLFPLSIFEKPGPDLLLKLRNLELVSLTCLSLRLSSKSCLKLHLETGPWSVMGSPGSASGQVNQVVIQYLSFSQNSPSSQKQGFYSGGKAQRRHLVADASKLRRTEGDSLFPFAKISWTQLPASQTKR